MQLNIQIELDGCPGLSATVRNTDTGEAFCYDADDGWVPEAEVLESGNAQIFDRAEYALGKCHEQVGRMFTAAWKANGGE